MGAAKDFAAQRGPCRGEVPGRVSWAVGNRSASGPGDRLPYLARSAVQPRLRPIGPQGALFADRLRSLRPAAVRRRVPSRRNVLWCVHVYAFPSLSHASVSEAALDVRRSCPRGGEDALRFALRSETDSHRSENIAQSADPLAADEVKISAFKSRVANRLCCGFVPATWRRGSNRQSVVDGGTAIRLCSPPLELESECHCGQPEDYLTLHILAPQMLHRQEFGTLSD